MTWAANDRETWGFSDKGTGNPHGAQHATTPHEEAFDFTHLH